VEASPIGQVPELAAPSHIGERLRQERNRQGMTVREIARRVGVSASLISQIERDKVNPSVSTLWGLVSVLGLTMGDLFSTAERPAGIEPLAAPDPAGPVTLPGARSVINLETGVHWERLTAGPDSLVEFLTVEYPPGAASCDEDSLVRHSGKEYGYVTKGRLAVRIGFDEYELGPGMAISFDASAPHRLWALGDQPAEAIWVVVGRQGDRRGPLL
jgi:transcriptional regulator with XRE-family HTH domain/quercetin dioxygenase-like cupin family protein